MTKIDKIMKNNPNCYLDFVIAVENNKNIMRILMLMEEMDNNLAAMELESLIEYIKFGQVK